MKSRPLTYERTGLALPAIRLFRWIPNPILLDDMQYLPPPLFKRRRNESPVTLPGEPLRTHECRAPILCDLLQLEYSCLICAGLRVGPVTALSISTQFFPQVDIAYGKFAQHLGQIFPIKVFESALGKAPHVCHDGKVIVTKQLDELLFGTSTRPYGIDGGFSQHRDTLIALGYPFHLSQTDVPRKIQGLV